MWFTPCSSSTSTARSAVPWATSASAAAPKTSRELRCPVRPNTAVAIGIDVLSSLPAGLRIVRGDPALLQPVAAGPAGEPVLQRGSAAVVAVHSLAQAAVGAAVVVAVGVTGVGMF